MECRIKSERCGYISDYNTLEQILHVVLKYVENFNDAEHYLNKSIRSRTYINIKQY